MSDAERIRELEEALRARDVEIADLKRQLAALTAALEAWKRGHRTRPGGTLAQKRGVRRTATGRGPGRPAGHAGTRRSAPTHVDREVVVPAATTCPFCGGAVEATDDAPGVHHVEDLAPARVEAIASRRAKGRCRDCHPAVLAPLPDGLGDNPKLGVRAQAEIVETKTDLGLTLGQTQRLFARQGLTVSRAGVHQILPRSALVLTPGHDQRKAAIPARDVAWADESPPKVAGASGDLWLVMTRAVVLYEADRSRGQEVAQRLFQGFTGALHADFYAVYGTLDGVTHVPRWGHLCRRARQVAERAPAAAVAAPTTVHDRLSALYVRGVHAQARPATAARNARAIKGDLRALAPDPALAPDADVARLQKRLTRHLDELVAFITDPAREATNNRPEREFRPHAQARHRSGGARSDAGAQTYAINLSIVRTLRLTARSFFDVFRQARDACFRGLGFPGLVSAATGPPDLAQASLS